MRTRCTCSTFRCVGVITSALVALAGALWGTRVALPSPVRFTVATLAVPAERTSLPVQLVLAHGWQLHLAPYAVASPWWTLGAWGITIVADTEEADNVLATVREMWRKPSWDALVVTKARRLAVQELRRWQRDPFLWLLWHARAIATGNPPLEPDQPLRVRLDEVETALQRLARTEPLLVTLSPPPAPKTPPATRSLNLQFRRTFSFPASQRMHALWWTVTSNSDPAMAMVVAEWLGAGTDATWFQLLRGDQPLAYHAFAQAHLTPFGMELALYSASLPENFTAVRQRAQRLFLALQKGKIGESALARAQQQALLRYRQMSSDLPTLTRTLAIWLMAGHSEDQWRQLPDRLLTVSADEVRAFCRSLPPFAELTGRP